MSEATARLATRASFNSTDSMTPDRSPAGPVSLGSVPVPSLLASWLAPFRDCFTAPVWQRVLVLVAGAVLAPGQRTVSAALRA